MSHDLPLGQILTTPQQRDAVHFAIAPVIAGEELRAGEHIGLFVKGGMEASKTAANLIGIVDPFLKVKAKKGERFYMFLYPNTVTGMRHEWSHPEFSSQTTFEQDAESGAWLKNYAEEVEMTLREVLDVAREYLKTGEIHCLSDDTPNIVYDKASEFWQHFSRYTGETVEVGKDDTFFHCAC